MGIKYSDSEVNVFHPLCEKALTAALQKLNLQKKYRVIHHQYTGSLEMDFCIQNQATKKYLCVIEVKRTPADVHSSRYQFQALSYVQSNEGNNEKPFYILTNLEYAFAFRYDKNRPRVFQQMLKPGLTSICNFGSQSDQEIVDELTDYFANSINDFVRNNYDYLVTLDEFANHMEQIKNNSKLWKSHLAVLLYEYIRGAFTFINRNDLKDIRLFNGDVKRICDEAVRINFKDIFTYDPNEFESKVSISGSILSDLFDFGSQNINADSVAGVLHQIVSSGQEHNGEVPTDLELGILVAELAKSISGELSENEKLCDPAAGSGNLISSAIGVFNISSSQIVVNDINSKLLELLSLRLGLGFPKTICKTTSPTIECKNIADIDSSFFADVKVVVMNPPFVGGIYCVDRKPPLYKKIRELTKATPISDVGQMPLEGVFLELVTHLVPKGTTIACIISKTHLMGRGPESQAIRRIILNKFGLRIVFTYPGKEIFDKVTKDTCVIVGKAMTPSESVNIYSSYDKVPDIDTHTFAESLKVSLTESFKPIMAGILAKSVQAEKLKQCIADGWRELNSEMIEAIEFTDRHLYSLAQFVKLDDLKIPIKRGTAGNNGGSDLLFFDSNTALFNKHKTSVSLGVAMRNAYYDSLDIGSGDSKFLVESKSSAQAIDDVLTDYLAIPLKPGKQPKKSKSKADLMAILKKEGANIFKGNAVLIPRDIRKNGKIYYSKSPVYVSTNFIVCNFASPDAALLVSTWMTTVFYQLICEVSSKDQEGARKMEKKDILTTLIPDLSKVSDDLVKAVKAEKDNITFLDLQNPVIRKTDRMWAKELFGNDADTILDEAVRLLEYLARKRNP